MINYPETDLILAVIGLVGLISTAVIVTTAIAQNRSEEIKLQRRNAIYRFDQDLME